MLASLILNCTSDSLQKTKILFDTDANNELDDQHALAYLLFNGQDFEVEGITVNKQEVEEILTSIIKKQKGL